MTGTSTLRCTITRFDGWVDYSWLAEGNQCYRWGRREQATQYACQAAAEPIAAEMRGVNPTIGELIITITVEEA